MAKSATDTKTNRWGGTTWITIAVLSIAWFALVGQGSLRRSVLLACLSLASFIVGSFIGFLFSTYGEEIGTLGKIRDWLIGGITALTVAKTSSLKAVLIVFAPGPGPTEFAYALGSAVLYAGLGFYFMYFYREIILNLMLARSRAERGKLEGSPEATHVVQRLLLRLPASVLSGVEDIDEVQDMNKGEAQHLKDHLYSDDVDTFLMQADEAAKDGTADWDIVSKTAYILYFRTYFEKENKAEAVSRALEWIIRALNMNPLHTDLTVRYVEMLDANEESEAAASVLERLALQNYAPMFVLQWLGYYLRFIPDRLDDAIRYSEKYHALFPSETDTLFNISYAYAHKYCLELAACTKAENLSSESRQRALSALKRALQAQPAMKERIRRDWIKEGTPLECLAKDKDFCQVIGHANESASVGPKPAGAG